MASSTSQFPPSLVNASGATALAFSEDIDLCPGDHTLVVGERNQSAFLPGHWPDGPTVAPHRDEATSVGPAVRSATESRHARTPWSPRPWPGERTIRASTRSRPETPTPTRRPDPQERPARKAVRWGSSKSQQHRTYVRYATNPHRQIQGNRSRNLRNLAPVLLVADLLFPGGGPSRGEGEMHHRRVRAVPHANVVLQVARAQRRRSRSALSNRRPSGPALPLRPHRGVDLRGDCASRCVHPERTERRSS